MIKVIGTAYRRPDFSQEQFFEYWRDVHGPISAKAPGLRGYVVTEVLDRVMGDLQADAFVEQWYDDIESYQRAMASPEVADAWADVPRYALTTGTFWTTREHILIPPPRPEKGLLR